MTEERFIEKNKETWNALENYNQLLLRKGIKALPQEEVKLFARLFRLTGFHLAYAKTHYPNGEALPYLNRIVGIAHNYFYVRETGSLADIRKYFTHLFPAAVRTNSRFFFAALALFFVGGIFAGLYVAADITRFNQIFPQNMVVGGDSSVEWDYPLMSAAIMTNNIRVAISAFVFGVTAGIGTVYLLLYNGLIIGALSAFMINSGQDMVVFLSLLLPHGVLELAAIFLSGACGLMIGKALLIPHPYSRKDAVIKNARAAAMLVPGIVTILVLAGLIEGFFTPLDISPVFKLVFAGLTLVGLLIYLLRR